jgi:hypothetical protein
MRHENRKAASKLLGIAPPTRLEFQTPEQNREFPNLFEHPFICKGFPLQLDSAKPRPKSALPIDNRHVHLVNPAIAIISTYMTFNSFRMNNIDRRNPRPFSLRVKTIQPSWNQPLIKKQRVLGWGCTRSQNIIRREFQIQESQGTRVQCDRGLSLGALCTNCAAVVQSKPAESMRCAVAPKF